MRLYDRRLRPVTLDDVVLLESRPWFVVGLAVPHLPWREVEGQRFYELDLSPADGLGPDYAIYGRISTFSEIELMKDTGEDT